MNYFRTAVLLGSIAPATAFAQAHGPSNPSSAPESAHGAPSHKISKDALAADPTTTVHVIVRFNSSDQSNWNASLSAARNKDRAKNDAVKPLGAERPEAGSECNSGFQYKPRAMYIYLQAYKPQLPGTGSQAHP